MKRSYILAATAILCWSTVATVVKLLLGSLTSMQVLFLSSGFAALALLVYNAATGRLSMLRGYKPRDYLITLLIGIPGTFLYYVFYYSGTARMPASQAFIINYLWPIMSVIFACIILRERLTVRKAVAILLSFLGVVIVTGADLSATGSDTLLGALFCVLGAVSYGVYTALNQRFGYDKRISMMFFYLTSFVLTGVINLCTVGLPEVSPLQILGFAWNGIFTMAVANTAWMLALESGKTAKISNLAYVTPFLSLIWTALVLKEDIRLLSVLGLAVIVTGILIQLKDKKNAPAEDVAAEGASVDGVATEEENIEG